MKARCADIAARTAGELRRLSRPPCGGHSKIRLRRALGPIFQSWGGISFFFHKCGRVEFLIYGRWAVVSRFEGTPRATEAVLCLWVSGLRFLAALDELRMKARLCLSVSKESFALQSWSWSSPCRNPPSARQWPRRPAHNCTSPANECLRCSSSPPRPWLLVTMRVIALSYSVPF